MKNGLRKLAALAVLALLPGLPAHADDDDRACAASDDHDRALAAVTAHEILPLSTILRNLATLFEGTLIEVELECEDGRALYVLELRTPAGRLVEITVDAVTGAIVPDDDE
ncbi:MAG: PepSY domain-containing protein [Bauldia sp.]|nr:PepSY domain-containing protein [Bauldia sp.]